MLLAALAAACTDELPAPAASLQLAPDRGPDNRETRVELKGDFLVARVVVDLSSADSPGVERLMQARLGMHPLADLELIGRGHVRATAPGRGMALGLYALEVEDAEGRASRLEGAFTIYQGTCADLGLTDSTANDCAARCAAEEGCGCTSGGGCATVCGDGRQKDAESCDDGNDKGEDGCGADCQVERGWMCSGEPSVCRAVCGDGMRVQSQEGCDDGDLDPADGCDARCQVEPGWRCRGQPSACELCGDGQLQGGETCDDANRMGGDGCSEQCRTEPGWTCDERTLPTRCKPTCGDGALSGAEQCDDGNKRSQDGCDETCQLEPGACCVGSPSQCFTTCGDGRVRDGEHCDDGNVVDGDGCGSCCKVELGFVCLRSPSLCARATEVSVVDDGASCPGLGSPEEPYCTIELAVLDPRSGAFINGGQYQEEVVVARRELSLVFAEQATLESGGNGPAFLVTEGARVDAVGLRVKSDVLAVGVVAGATLRLEQAELGPGAGLGLGLQAGGTLALDRAFVHENRAGGLRLEGEGYRVTNTVIARNGEEMSEVGGVLIVSTATAAGLFAGDFVNNTVVENRAASFAGVRCEGPNLALSLVQNSIIYDNGEVPTVSALTCRPSSSLVSPLPGGTPLPGNLTGDPRFLPNDPFYHLSPASPCIDQGVSLLAPALDIDGEHRPLGQGVDLGADEAR